jgi:SAM-dependent methyltransferase
MINFKTWLKYKEVYEKRANDDFEEKCDKSRYSRIPFYFRYCLPNMKNVLVLDIGAADGIVVERFKENGIGCDIAFKYCRKMKSKGIQSVCCTAEYLPFRKGAFGLIISSAILEHVIDLRKSVNEIIRLTREGGLVLVNVPYLEDLTQYLYCKYEFSHVRSFDETFLMKLFSDLDVVQVYYHDFSLIVMNIQSLLLNRIFGILYASTPKTLRYILLKTKWTSWTKPFSITIIFRKRKDSI